MAEFWREMATINGKARALGEALQSSKESFERLFDLPQEIEAVTLEDLHAVAGRFLYRNNATSRCTCARPEDDE